MFFIILIGLMALYALTVASFLHSAIAAILAGTFFGIFLGGIVLCWQPKGKWLFWLPVVLFFLLAVWRALGPQFSDFCTALGLSFLLGYLRLQRLEEAIHRSVLREEQQMRQQNVTRRFLEGEIFERIQALKAGETVILCLLRQDVRLLMRLVLSMQKQGWLVRLYEDCSGDLFSLILLHVVVTAPESEEALQASLATLSAQLKPTEE